MHDRPPHLSRHLDVKILSRIVLPVCEFTNSFHSHQASSSDCCFGLVSALSFVYVNQAIVTVAWMKEFSRCLVPAIAPNDTWLNRTDTRQFFYFCWWVKSVDDWLSTLTFCARVCLRVGVTSSIGGGAPRSSRFVCEKPIFLESITCMSDCK